MLHINCLQRAQYCFTEQRKEIHIYFHFSLSGHLSPSKFTELCRKVFGSKQAEELQEKAFSRFDKHNNGSVNFRDFLMVIHLTSNGAPEDKLRTMFSLYDLNNDGSIDSGEMER